MKTIIEIARTHYSSVLYLGFLMVAISNKEVGYAVLFFLLILYEISDYRKEKYNKEYTKWVEDRADHWYQKYKEEKYGKKECQKTTTTICKN